MKIIQVIVTENCCILHIFSIRYILDFSRNRLEMHELWYYIACSTNWKKSPSTQMISCELDMTFHASVWQVSNVLNIWRHNQNVNIAC